MFSVWNSKKICHLVEGSHFTKQQNCRPVKMKEFAAGKTNAT